MTEKAGDTLEDCVSWCKKLPKVELHAHLNGSIRTSTWKELAIAKLGHDATMHVDDEAARSSIENCFRVFDLIYKVTTSLDVIARITREMIEDWSADNVKYLEIRTTPRAIPGTPMNKRSYIETVLSTIKEVAPKHDIVVGLIVSINRGENSDEAMETAKLALEFHSKGVVGLDLCGNPKIGHFNTFLPVLQFAKANGLKITLHFAEVYNPEESKGMLHFKPDRLSHACYLDGQIKELLQQSGIPIEMCITSNIVTHSVKTYCEHHFHEFMRRNHPLALNTDDAGVMSTTLSREYGVAAYHFNLSREDVFSMVLSSINCIFSDDSVKTSLRHKFSDIIQHL